MPLLSNNRLHKLQNHVMKDAMAITNGECGGYFDVRDDNTSQVDVLSRLGDELHAAAEALEEETPNALYKLQ